METVTPETDILETVESATTESEIEVREQQLLLH